MNAQQKSHFDMLTQLDAGEVVELWLAIETPPSGASKLAVVKLLKKGLLLDPIFSETILDAATHSRALNHPGILAARDLEIQEDSAFIVTSLVRGEKLSRFTQRAWSRGNALPPHVALSIVASLAEALTFAHTQMAQAQQGILHSCISPSDVFLSYSGDIQLANFDWIKSELKPNTTTSTIGDAKYVAPELITGQGASAATDVYSLGVLLWELLAGRQLYMQDDEFALMEAICEEQAPPPSTFNSQVPRLIEAIVSKALAKVPSQRFTSAAAFADALSRSAKRLGRANFKGDLASMMRAYFPLRAKAWREVEQAELRGDWETCSSRVTALYQDQILDVEEEEEKTVRFDAGSSARPPALEEQPAAFVSSAPFTTASPAQIPSNNAQLSQPVQLGPAEDPITERQNDIIEDLPSTASEHDIVFDDKDSDSLPTSEFNLVDDSELFAAAKEDVDETQQTAPPKELARPSYQEPKVDYIEEPKTSRAVDLDALVHEMFSPQEVGDEPEELPVEPKLQENTDQAIQREEGQGLGIRASSSLMGELELDEGEEERVIGVDLEELFVEGPPPMPKDAGAKAKPVLEVARLIGQRVSESTVLRGLKKNYRSPTGDLIVLRNGKVAEIKVSPEGKGLIYHREGAPELIQGGTNFKLAMGESARIEIGDYTYQLRFYGQVRALFEKMLAPAAIGASVIVAIQVYGLAAIAAVSLHVGALYSFEYVGSQFDLTVEKDEGAEIFAEGTIKKKEVKKEDNKPKPKKKAKPKPKPKPKAKPKPKPKPADPTEQSVQIPKAARSKLDKKLRSRQEARKGGGGGGKKAASADSVVDALTSPVAGDGQTLSDVTTNVDAPNTTGLSSTFKVGGTLSALPGAESINVGKGGGGALGELGGKVATEGKVAGQLGERDGKKKGKAKVRGKVKSMKGLTKVKGGTLTRGQVLDVVGKHMGKIQSCYERELNDNPSLSGKITFDWTVQSSGKVSAVREVSSSLGSNEVSKCIMKVIKKMKFPKPKGGDAQIRFPFIFKAS